MFSARLRALSAAAAAATTMACPLATRLRAAGSVTGGGLRLLGAAPSRDSRSFGASSSRGGARSSAAEAADSSKSGVHASPARLLYPSSDDIRAYSVEVEDEVSRAVEHEISRDSRSSCICGADGYTPRLIYPLEVKQARAVDKVVNRLNEILDKRMSPQQSDVQVERYLEQHKAELQKQMSSQKEYFEQQLSGLKEELSKKIFECKLEVKNVETKTDLVTQHYNFFQAHHDLKMKEVQLSVLKTTGSVAAGFSGLVIAYVKVKDHLKEIKEWFGF